VSGEAIMLVSFGSALIAIAIAVAIAQEVKYKERWKNGRAFMEKLALDRPGNEWENDVVREK
jgi:hypothetical protein